MCSSILCQPAEMNEVAIVLVEHDIINLHLFTGPQQMNMFISSISSTVLDNSWENRFNHGEGLGPDRFPSEGRASLLPSPQRPNGHLL